jgi:hypothetical protein
MKAIIKFCNHGMRTRIIVTNVKCDKYFFYSLIREKTFVVISDKGVVILFAAGMELHSCCRACLFILAFRSAFF